MIFFFKKCRHCVTNARGAVKSAGCTAFHQRLIKFRHCVTFLPFTLIQTFILGARHFRPPETGFCRCSVFSGFRYGGLLCRFSSSNDERACRYCDRSGGGKRDNGDKRDDGDKKRRGGFLHCTHFANAPCVTVEMTGGVINFSVIG